MGKKPLAQRVDELERKLVELWRHESHLSGMVLKHLEANGEKVDLPKAQEPAVDPGGESYDGVVVVDLASFGRDAGVMKRGHVLSAILIERMFQNLKWGDLETQNDRDVSSWIRCIYEELSEAEEERRKFDLRKEEERGPIPRDVPKEFFLELVQTAASCIACLEQLGPNNIDELMTDLRKDAMEELRGKNSQ